MEHYMHWKLRTSRLMLASYLLSTLCGIGVLIINYRIATVYAKADGKTRALFGLVEWTFSAQYYFAPPLLVALGHGFASYRRSANRQALGALLLASIVAILLASCPWRLLT